MAEPVYKEREELVDISEGQLYVTNKKLLFVGEKRSTTITFGRIVSYERYREGIEVVKSTGKPDLFRLAETDAEFLDGLLQVLE